MTWKLFFKTLLNTAPRHAILLKPFEETLVCSKGFYGCDFLRSESMWICSRTLLSWHRRTAFTRLAVPTERANAYLAKGASFPEQRGREANSASPQTQASARATESEWT